MAQEFSNECRDVLQLLASSKNVLISGPPGTGKSRLLGEIASAFAQTPASSAKPSAAPVHSPKAAVPIPKAAAPAATSAGGGIVAPKKNNRKVFRTVFHQNSKHRDFVTGMIPNVKRKSGESEFLVARGMLYDASEFAKQSDGAALLIIDEINRGPAVQIFGGSIVAIEASKRLGVDGKEGAETQYFDVLDPETGIYQSYALPDDLYIVAAMNQADASVEPLDVAFLRRWEPYVLTPESSVLRQYYKVSMKPEDALPDAPKEPQHVFEASIRAWEKVNRRISLGRGPEFQIGHGVLISNEGVSSIEHGLALAARHWMKVRAHVEEVFFGDLRGIAATLNAIDPPEFHPLQLQETPFADDVRFELAGPKRIEAEQIYNTLRAIAAD